MSVWKYRLLCPLRLAFKSTFSFKVAVFCFLRMWFNFCVRYDIMLLECMEYLNLICNNVSPVWMTEERQ